MLFCAACFLVCTLFIENALNKCTLRAEFPLWTFGGSFRKCCWNGPVGQMLGWRLGLLFTYFHADVNLLVSRQISRPAKFDSD